jgi:hypothetical protein
MDKFEMVHISRIRSGDTIEHNGKIMTVCNNDFSYSELMGVSIFGDCYQLGNKLVKRILL